MTEQQKQLVQMSWKSIETIGGMVPTLIYAKLFELDASTRLLFPGDTGEHGLRRHEASRGNRSLSQFPMPPPSARPIYLAFSDEFRSSKTIKRSML